MKKLMVLGGSRYALPVIKAAHDLGIYVITCDYLPDNIAHKYSDEYCNVSIIDKEKTLAAAQRLEIDGIMSFACDPGVITAAYVAEQMGLPNVGPYESVCIDCCSLNEQQISEQCFDLACIKLRDSCITVISYTWVFLYFYDNYLSIAYRYAHFFALL